MGLFDSLRRVEPPEPREPSRGRLSDWYHPGRNVIPTVLPFDRLLTRRPELAVFISTLRIYPRGLEFDVDVLRPRSGAHAVDAMRNNPFATHVPRGHPRFMVQNKGAVRFGVRYADGRGGSTGAAAASSINLAARLELPVIRPSGGRGTPGHWNQRYRVSGLPESGDIELVYSWPAEGVPETAFALDGDAVRAAAAKAVVLWDEPEDEDSRPGGFGGFSNPAS